MKKNALIISALMCITLFSFTSCEKDDISENNQYANVTVQNNEIKYFLNRKVPYETVNKFEDRYFNVPIVSHTFNEDRGVITFEGDVTTFGLAFSFLDSWLKAIIIPNSVTNIGELAFMASHLEHFKIPDNVVSIGQNAFYYTKLKEIEIPASVKEIGTSAFGSTPIEKIVVNASNPKYDSRNNCNAIIETASNTLIVGCKNTKIPNGVTKIGNYAFQDCADLTDIKLPNTLTSIEEGAFSGCTNLETLNIPSTVNHIYDYYLIRNSIISNCPSLISLTVEPGNTIYDSRNNCNAIIETANNKLIVGCKSTVIPNSVESIGMYAFQYCTNLKSINIPSSVKSIDIKAFYGCIDLESVTMSNGVKSIGPSAFDNCKSLTDINIPNSVTEIGLYAFSGCSSLTNIQIPNSVKLIGSSAFKGCSSLTSIQIPNSINQIGVDAFRDCSSLTSIQIPNSVNYVGDGAFYKCSSLTSIQIPNSVTQITMFAPRNRSSELK